MIEAFNDDMPYDRFVKLQIAADLIRDGRRRAAAPLPALGFFGLGAAVLQEHATPPRPTADELDDRVDTLTRGFLGLTVAVPAATTTSSTRSRSRTTTRSPASSASTQAGRRAARPKAEVERITAAQKKVADADKAVKDFLQAEKAALAAAKADELPKYLLAAWKLGQRREAEAGRARSPRPRTSTGRRSTGWPSTGRKTTAAGR